MKNPPHETKSSVDDALNDSRVVMPGPLPMLEDVLWEWIAIQERSARMWNGEDALWWYGERTSLGGFAGVVWRSGGYVLEEYATEKLLGKGTTSKEEKKRKGRGDMDFVFGGQNYTIEAKQCWPLLKNPLPKLQRTIEAAKTDVKASSLLK